MSAREDILARVRSALTDIDTAPRRPGPEALVERPGGALSVHPEGDVSPGEEVTLALFTENVADYRATVLRTAEADATAAIVRALRAVECRSVVVPTGLDPAWQQALAEAFEAIPEAEAGSAQVLDTIDAVVTGSAVGIATTGTIVIDHSADQGRRELTLVPDTHVCVIRHDQVVHDVPEAVSRLGNAPHRGQPLTWISGPSATSDIELQRVEGVHGPRTLIVVLVEPAVG